MLLDGSGSIYPDEWNTEINGLHDAILSPACFPDCYVELTVIQFASFLPGFAVTEVAPTVITDSNRLAIANDVLSITKSSGNTPIEAGIDLAVDELTSSPYFASAQKQIINISSDVGEYVVDFNATEIARDNAIAAGIDEISAEGLGDIRPVDIDWLRDEIVYPQPGSIAPPFTPGWVYEVGIDAAKFTEAICHKISPVPIPTPTPTHTPTPTPTPTLTPTPTICTTWEFSHGILDNPTAVFSKHDDCPDIALPTGTEPGELIVVWYYDEVAMEWKWYRPGWPESTLDTLEYCNIYTIIVMEECTWEIPYP